MLKARSLDMAPRWASCAPMPSARPPGTRTPKIWRMDAGARQERIRTNGIELSCAVAGDRGDLVVLLHGFPESAYEWRHQIPALAERFRVVAPDLRGYGASSKPAGIAAYRPGVIADDVVGLIRAVGADERAFAIPGVAPAALNYYRAAFREGLRGGGTGGGRVIAAPTLLIWGDEDFALGRELAEGMERYFSGPFEIRHIPDCSHWVPEERPDLVNKWLLEFLS